MSSQYHTVCRTGLGTQHANASTVDQLTEKSFNQATYSSTEVQHTFAILLNTRKDIHLNFNVVYTDSMYTRVNSQPSAIMSTVKDTNYMKI